MKGRFALAMLCGTCVVGTAGRGKRKRKAEQAHFASGKRKSEEESGTGALSRADAVSTPVPLLLPCPLAGVDSDLQETQATATPVFEVPRSRIRQNSGRCGGRQPSPPPPEFWEFGYFRSKCANFEDSGAWLGSSPASLGWTLFRVFPFGAELGYVCVLRHPADGCPVFLAGVFVNLNDSRVQCVVPVPLAVGNPVFKAGFDVVVVCFVAAALQGLQFASRRHRPDHGVPHFEHRSTLASSVVAKQRVSWGIRLWS